MKYFLDTEFIEGKQTYGLPFYIKKTKFTIDLISIGIVSEDNREYYAISKDFNLKEAWNRHEVKTKWIKNIGTQYKEYWIRDNILKSIFFDLAWKDFHLTHFKDTWLSNDMDEAFDTFLNVESLSNNYKWFKKLLNKYGKTNKEIAKEIRNFVYEDSMNSSNGNATLGKNNYTPIHIELIEFYGYYADYDWVVFCWLFGRMIDLPKGFPMYCIDLKQMLDNEANKLSKVNYNNTVTGKKVTNTFKDKLNFIKDLKNYPKQSNEHNALDDAKWNKKLYKFLNTI